LRVINSENHGGRKKLETAVMDFIFAFMHFIAFG
jgi:hypothetical protein